MIRSKASCHSLLGVTRGLSDVSCSDRFTSQLEWLDGTESGFFLRLTAEQNRPSKGPLFLLIDGVKMDRVEPNKIKGR